MDTLTNPAFKTGPDIGLFGNKLIVDSGDIAVGTADIALNGLILAFKARKGFCVTGALMQATDLDTGGSPAIALKLGDAADDDRFIAASNIGQAGGFTATLAATGMFYEFTADTDVYMKVSTAAATAAAGTVRCALEGYLRKV